MNKKHLGSIHRLSRLHSDRLPGNGAASSYSVHDGAGEAQTQKARTRILAQSKIGISEYEKREAAAREVKHCIMPLPKSNYIVVTDKSLISQMGKKTVF